METYSIFSLNREKYQNIDPRLKPFLNGWKAHQKYKGKDVYFFSDKKGTWDATITPYKYFQVIKSESDSNYKKNGEEDEIVLCLWAGWGSFDDEIDIRLHIRGSDVEEGTNKVSAEILNTGGAPIELFRNGKKICEFNRNFFWRQHKIWIEDIANFT